MIWLCIGVLLFMLVHFVPSLAPALKRAITEKVGENPYRGLFALNAVIAVGLMVVGWRSTTPEFVYLPPTWGPPLTSVLMLFAVMLFGAAHQPTRIKRYVRHPQLTGLLVWSVSHLLSNGESRSLVLFGGLGLWALLEMFLINRREGAWVRPHDPSFSVEIRGVIISAVVFFVLVFLHPYFTGVPAIPR